MADVFLHLELDKKGIKAKILELSQSQAIIRDECQVLYENITPTDDNAGFFDLAMNRVDQSMDLALCSSAIILLSDCSVSFRTLQLPFKSEKKIRKILPFELEMLMPISDVDYISDFHVLDNYNEAYPILSASIDESTVDQYFSTLERFGIKPVIITPTGYAAAVEFLKLQTENSNFAFLHVSNYQMTLVVVSNEKPYIVRSFGTENLLVRDIAKTIRQTLVGFSQRTGIQENFELFICSDEDGSAHSPIYEAFDTIMEYEQKVAPNRYKIEAEGLLCSISPEKKSKYLFNFCKGEYGTSSFVTTYFTRIAASVVLLICALSLMLINVGFDNANLSEQVENLDNQAGQIFKKAFPKKRVVNNAYMEMAANVRAALKKGNNGKDTDILARNKEIKVVNILAELSQKIDADLDMEIARFLFNNQRLVLSGATEDFNNVDKIKGKLESSDLFKRVNISSAASDKRENKVNFKFIIDI